MNKLLFYSAFVICFTAFANSDACLAEDELSVSVHLTSEGELRILGDDQRNRVVLSVRDGIIGAAISTFHDGVEEWVLRGEPIESVDTITCILGDGNDELRSWCQDTLQADVDVDTGRGADRMTWYGDLRSTALRNPAAAIAGDLSINTGLDDDGVSFQGQVVLGTTFISTGHGADNIAISSSFSDGDFDQAIGIPSEFGGGLYINTGLHNDIVNFNVQRIGDSYSADGVAAMIGVFLEVQCGQGDDSVGAFWSPTIVDVLGTARIVGGQGSDSCEDVIILADELTKIGFEN